MTAFVFFVFSAIGISLVILVLHAEEENKQQLLKEAALAEQRIKDQEEAEARKKKREADIRILLKAERWVEKRKMIERSRPNDRVEDLEEMRSLKDSDEPPHYCDTEILLNTERLYRDSKVLCEPHPLGHLCSIPQIWRHCLG